MNATLNGDIVINENNVTLKNITVNGSITVMGDNVTIADCTVVSEKDAIISYGRHFIAKNNKIECKGSAISLLSGSYNSLVAQNSANGDITVTKAFNCSVILNCADKFIGCECTSLYVVDNKLCNTVELTKNKYIICDGNKCSQEMISENQFANGDNLQDVNARLEFGADEDLLPHTNKDLFLGMERKLAVTAPDLEETFALNEYIANKAKENEIVIVPPGAYTVNSLIELTGNHSNTVIYAYGVYLEITDYVQCLNMSGAENIAFKGLTIGYRDQSAGQMQILNSLGENRYLCISSAGFTREFGQLDPSVFSSGGYFFRPREEVSWTEIGYWGGYTVIPNEKGELINSDGTFVIEIANRDTSFDFISHLRRGEILTCRMQKQPRSIFITDSKHICFKDTVTYGFAGAICFVIAGKSEDITLYRHHNLSHSAYEIDKETYEKYKALEEKYNVDLEIYIDEKGRYRGSKPRIGSVDATHVTRSSKGLDAVSSLFENACDDATNQRGDSSCLDKIIDNRDGTSTLIIKDNIPGVYYGLYQRFGKEDFQPGHNAAEFANGDRIFAYASNGKILCDTTVISDAEQIEEKRLLLETDYDHKGEKKHMRWYSRITAVNVRTADLNMSAIEGIDTQINSYTMDNKVLVDNLSRNSTNFTFDNCMVRHNRGRVVVKTRNATIKNCTFKDTSYAGVVMSVESTWGESSVPCHVTVSKCLFDGASRTLNKDKDTKYAAIAVEGLGSGNADVVVSADTLPAKDITIEGNVFRNIRNDYCITLSAVQDITVKNNVFEPRSREDCDNVPGAIYLNGCMNVDIENNQYSSNRSDAIVAKNYSNLTGIDVEGMLTEDKST